MAPPLNSDSVTGAWTDTPVLQIFENLLLQQSTGHCQSRKQWEMKYYRISCSISGQCLEIHNLLGIMMEQFNSMKYDYKRICFRYLQIRFLLFSNVYDSVLCQSSCEKFFIYFYLFKCFLKPPSSSINIICLMVVFIFFRISYLILFWRLHQIQGLKQHHESVEIRNLVVLLTKSKNCYSLIVRETTVRVAPPTFDNILKAAEISGCFWRYCWSSFLVSTLVSSSREVVCLESSMSPNWALVFQSDCLINQCRRRRDRLRLRYSLSTSFLPVEIEDSISLHASESTEISQI